ncbi:MAG: DUF308 domain-containing protein [Clostridia bacterium]|nr:DUF308 domain-containing protein [Clostridia bacterium]
MKDLVKKNETSPEKKAKSAAPADYGRQFKWDILITALVVIIFGALFVTFPAESIDVLCYAFGIAMTVWGVISIISYFLSENSELFNSYGLVRGIAFLAIGVVVLANPEEVAALFISIFGALLIIDGALKLQYSVDAIRAKEKWWQILMSAAFAVIILGGVVIFNPFKDQDTQMLFTGISMIVDGVIDAVMVFYISNIIKRLKKEAEEKAE